MTSKPAILLSDNHRRGITTSLRLLDQMLCEFEEYARGKETRSVLYRERNRLSAAEQIAVLAEIRQMREGLRQIAKDLDLEAEEEDVARKIWGFSSGFWEILVETTTRYLRRYGSPPLGLAEYLDPRLEDLIAHLRTLTELVSGTGDRRLRGPRECAKDDAAG